MKKQKVEQAGDGIETQNAFWSFGGNVSNKFSEHVRRSVPLYQEGHSLVCQLSDFFVKQDSICYELGSSVGELTYMLAKHHATKPQVRWIGIDCEESMIDKARENNPGIDNVDFVVDDVNLFPYEKSDLIVCYYTVQFVSPKLRQDLFDKIFESLNWGGALLLFEKVRGADARFQDILTTLYNDFKLKNNYTPEEIISKTRSLKGILEPFSTQGNLDLLKRAGFSDIMTVMKYLCFEGFLAIK